MSVGKGARMGGVAQLCYAAVALYRVTLAAFVGGHCRFVPSCSAYAQDALRGRPTATALKMIVRRLLRCHPWHPGGSDPVSPK